MLEAQKENVTINKQSIKKISHQDIYALYDLLEQLTSWNEPLQLLECYFNKSERPLNKQKIAKQYYANSKLFNAFYSDFQEVSKKMERQILKLRQKEKLRI
ncbi:TPA: hypothetical protein ACIKQS_001003 [Enterococcus faecalis]|uniref:hypothetical protein n=1 Tax=Enterococcus faecalis TaxID=1351 RepID=UPI0027D9CC94|nr:hypothetical protein [Enterococcus faecalis]MDQ4499525.1 hypothetical protein [Enterococcus faecalis]